MTNRVAAVLLILLVLASGFGGYEAFLNQQRTIENRQLKQQLANQASQLQTLEEEKRQLRTELNQTNAKLTELDAKVATLEQQVQNMTNQIEKLREQLKLRDYTTIGLTFLWNKEIQEWTDHLSPIVQDLNREWDPLHIYFFIYHAAAADLPLYQGCSSIPSWATQAWNRYPGNDIPIAVFSGFTLLGGSDYVGCAWPTVHVIGVVQVYLYDRELLTHELVHIFGISDEEMGPLAHRSIAVIPSAWYGRIQTAAKWFQMPLPLSS